MNVQAGPGMAALAAIKANYSLTPEQRQIVDHVDRVAREILHPLQEKMDAEEWWPEDLFRQMGELGLLGITAPEELGGSGQNEFTQALVSETISKWNPAVGLSHGAHDNLCLNNILSNGSDEQVRPVRGRAGRRTWADRARRGLGRAGLDGHQRRARWQ